MVWFPHHWISKSKCCRCHDRQELWSQLQQIMDISAWRDPAHYRSIWICSLFLEHLAPNWGRGEGQLSESLRLVSYRVARVSRRLSWSHAWVGTWLSPIGYYQKHYNALSSPLLVLYQQQHSLHQNQRNYHYPLHTYSSYSESNINIESSRKRCFDINYI